MKHLRRFNEENIFKNIFRKFLTPNAQLVANLSDKFGMNYNRIGEMGDPHDDEEFIMGPKNGHEITVKFKEDQYGDEQTLDHNTGDIILVRPSYYGTFYEEEKEVNDLESYLSNFDFDHKPDVTHKYNYHVRNERISNFKNFNKVNEARIYDYTIYVKKL